MISFSFFRRRGATLAGVFGVALSSVVLLCGAGSVPVKNLLPQGAMQGDLDAGGHNLTNVGTVSVTNVIVSGSLTAPGSFTMPFAQITSSPTTLSGYGITDPVALTSGSYANPAWITSLAYSKLTGAPSAYTLPNATTSTLGGVIVGTGLSVSSGTVSANVTTVAGRTGAITLSASDISSLGALATVTPGTGVTTAAAQATNTASGLTTQAGTDARYNRLNGFSPFDIAGLTAWLDPSRQGLADGATVTSFTDSSGNGNNFAAAGTGANPVFQAIGISGFPSINDTQVDSTHQSYFTSPFNIDSTWNTSFTAVVVMQEKALPTTNNSTYLWGSSEGNAFLRLRIPSTAGAPAFDYRAASSGTGNGAAQIGNVSMLTPNVFVISYNGTTLRIFQNGVQIRDSAFTGSMASTGTWFFGNSNYQGASSSSTVLLGDCLLYKYGCTLSEGIALSRYFMTKYHFPKDQIIGIGDSQLEGDGITGDAGLFKQMFDLLGRGQFGYSAANGAQGGLTLWQYSAYATLASQTAGILTDNATRVAIVWDGSNDIGGTGNTAAATYTLLTNQCANVRAAGYKVVVGTMLPKTPVGTQEAQRQIFNTNIAATWTNFADALADVGNNPLIGPSSGNTNTTYYAADANHLNNAGMAIAAPIFANAYLRAIAPTASAGGDLTTVTGSTSGTAIFSESSQSATYKKVVVNCQALVGTASYTFPAAFQYAPRETDGLGLATTITTTGVTVTGSTTTGFVILEGY